MHATHSKTQQGFSFKICVFPQTKISGFIFLPKKMDLFHPPHHCFPSLCHYSELISCEGIGKHLCQTKEHNPISFLQCRERRHSENKRPPHLTFQVHLETGTFAKAVPRVCRSPLSPGKVGAALLLGAVTFPLLPVLSQRGSKPDS